MVNGRHARVLVVGASGIGKHHAKWWHLEGAEVCAFVGASDESIARTRETLVKVLPFAGQGYTDLGMALRAEAPDIVDVCTPPQFHYEHVRTALEAGHDVLCEKPFVFDRGLKTQQMMEQARELDALATRQGKRLGICTQYTKCADILEKMWREDHGNTGITRVIGHIEAPARSRAPDPVRIWVDLSSHPLSVLQRLYPKSQINWTTVTTAFEGYEATAAFTLCPVSGPLVQCEIIVRNTPTGGNLRRFTFNETVYQIEGEDDAQGIYNARIITTTGSRIEPDMMRLLIRQFLKGCPAADATDGVINLWWLLSILAASGNV